MIHICEVLERIVEFKRREGGFYMNWAERNIANDNYPTWPVNDTLNNLENWGDGMWSYVPVGAGYYFLNFDTTNTCTSLLCNREHYPFMLMYTHPGNPETIVLPLRIETPKMIFTQLSLAYPTREYKQALWERFSEKVTAWIKRNSAAEQENEEVLVQVSHPAWETSTASKYWHNVFNKKDSNSEIIEEEL